MENKPANLVWVAVNVMELKAFVGICLLMGIMKLPSRRYYWKKNGWLATKIPLIMSRDRFENIWRFLHLVNNADRNANDKLYKLRFFIDHINAKFKEIYTPSNHLSIDESMKSSL